MTIWKKIRENYKCGLRTRDTKLIDYMRNARSVIEEDILKQNIRDRQADPGDELAEASLKAYVKRLEKGIKLLGPGDLSFQYENEIGCIRVLLLPPPEAPPSVLLEVVQRAIDKLEATGNPQKTGQVIGYVMKNNPGIDGKVVSQLVRDLLCQE